MAEKMSRKKCTLCGLAVRDKIKYGEFIELQKEKIRVHYYCILLSSILPQKGRDDEGVLGFLPADIRKEQRRAGRVKCYYCNERRANIACCNSRCRRSFHLKCGIDNNCEVQFKNLYKSFCHRHVTNEFRLETKDNLENHCIICWENFSLPEVYCYQLPCCRDGFYHKFCMQRYAIASGYFCKCPLCNNTENFKDVIQLSGIYLPQKDADWELEPNGYDSLLERPMVCSALNCLCPDGREMNDSMEYDLLYCSVCGSVAMHAKCSSTQFYFICVACEPFFPIVSEGTLPIN